MPPFNKLHMHSRKTYYADSLFVNLPVNARDSKLFVMCYSILEKMNPFKWIFFFAIQFKSHFNGQSSITVKYWRCTLAPPEA